MEWWAHNFLVIGCRTHSLCDVLNLSVTSFFLSVMSMRYIITVCAVAIVRVWANCYWRFENFRPIFIQCVLDGSSIIVIDAFSLNLHSIHIAPVRLSRIRILFLLCFVFHSKCSKSVNDGHSTISTHFDFESNRIESSLPCVQFYS